MEYSASAVPEGAVDELAHFLHDIFDAALIQSMETRRAFCVQLLSDSTFVEQTTGRFDLEAMVQNAGGALAETLDVVKSSISIDVSLSSAQETILKNHSPDYVISVRPTTKVQHTLAYAHRKIDTARCRADITFRYGTVLDIGGNYATHAMSNNGKIHCCTLLDDADEYHRQTQRDALLALGDYASPDYCVGGVQNCEIAAKEAISVHTLPRIDPKDITKIFRRHGLSYITGVHHYDAAMDYANSGYMPGVEMHWQVDESTGIVEHFFEGDSSYAYKHRLDWLQFYSRTQFFTESDWDQVVYYAIDRLEDGLLYWTMTLMEKATLGTQELSPQYRYIDNEQQVVLSVPEFNPALGYAISDPRAYEVVTYRAPVDLFAFVYKAAISNDTTRPDLPISLDTVLSYTQTFAYTKRINGTSITTPAKMSSDYANAIAKGIYLVVVYRAAHLRVVNQTYTDMFIRIQKRWGDENFFSLATKCFSMLAISPFLMLATSFNDAIDLVVVQMRASIASSRVLAAATSELPYHLVSPVSVIPFTATRAFVRESLDIGDDVEIASSEVDLQQFYDIFKEQLSPSHRSAVEDKLAKSRKETEDTIKQAMENSDELPVVTADRESWEEAMFYVADKVPIAVPNPVQIGTSEQVLDNFALKIFEAGLYNYDVAFNSLSAAKDRCLETWSGTEPRMATVNSRNIVTKIGMRYIKLENGYIPDGLGADSYMVFLEPTTMDLLSMPTVFPAKIDIPAKYIFVCDSFKIFIGLSLGKKMTSLARKVKFVPVIEYILVDGVPGCGKTHEIVNSVTPEDIIACTVRETAHSTRQRVIKQKPLVQPERIRTVTSFQHNKVPFAKTVYIDEGLMMMPGDAHYISFEARAKQVRIFGDSAQIGFIDRGSKLGVMRFPTFDFWTNIEQRNVSNRVPADVCFLMRMFYPESRRSLIKTSSSVMRSLAVNYVSELTHAVYTIAEPGVHVMTFLQADKGKMLMHPNFVDAKATVTTKSRLIATVASVHESQGGDYPHVSVMRLNPHTEGAFDSDPHKLVALTRHTHTFKYCTVMPFGVDKYASFIESGIRATDEQLRECMVDTPQWLSEKIDKMPLRGVVS